MKHAYQPSSNKWSKNFTKGRIAGADFSRGRQCHVTLTSRQHCRWCSSGAVMSLLIFCSGDLQYFSMGRTTPTNCPFPCEDLDDPPLIMVSWAYLSHPPKRHLDRFSRFAGHTSVTNRHTHTRAHTQLNKIWGLLWRQVGRIVSLAWYLHVHPDCPRPNGRHPRMSDELHVLRVYITTAIIIINNWLCP